MKIYETHKKSFAVDIFNLLIKTLLRSKKSQTVTDGSYRFFLFEKHSAVERDVVPVPALHPGVVLLLEVRGEDALLGLAQHAVQPGGVSQLARGDGGLRISLEIKILI